MKSYKDLYPVLVNILGNKSVYFQAPPKLSYPCMMVSLSDVHIRKADDTLYTATKKFQIILIGKDLENDKVIEQLLLLPYCNYDRRYISDNLYHDVFTLFY